MSYEVFSKAERTYCITPSRTCFQQGCWLRILPTSCSLCLRSTPSVLILGADIAGCAFLIAWFVPNEMSPHASGGQIFGEVKNSSFRRLEINSSPTYLCRLEDSRHVLVDVEWPLCTMSVSPKPITIYIHILKAICIVRLTLWDTSCLQTRCYVRQFQFNNSFY